MKKNAFASLIKNVLTAGIAWVIGIILINSFFGISGSDAQFMAFYVACIPFGWRWSSKIITALSFQGICLKLLISLILGMFAIFVVIGWDVVCCIGQILRFCFGFIGAKKHQYGYVESC